MCLLSSGSLTGCSDLLVVGCCFLLTGVSGRFMLAGVRNCSMKGCRGEREEII